MRQSSRGSSAGSVVLLVVVALLVLRPWEGSGGAHGGGRAAVDGPRVVRVVDGDTIEVGSTARREDVRLIGVDTPETVKPDTPVQCFGPRASAFTHRLLEGGGCGSSSASSAATSTAGCSPTSTSGDRFVNASWSGAASPAR